MRALFLIASFVIVFTPTIVNAQDSVVKYYSENWQKASVKEYYYKRVITKKGKKKWLVKDYFQNNQLQGVSHYKNRRLTKPVDSFSIYYENGRLMSSFSYNDDGQLDGVFNSYFEEGGIDKQKVYKDGKLTGGQSWYYRNGNVSWYEFYRNDSLIFIQTFDVEGKEQGFKVQTYYRPKWQDLTYRNCNEYIQKNVSTFEETGLQLDVTLYIDYTGKVVHVEMDADKSRYQEVIKLLMDSPRWRPGKDHLRPWNSVIEVQLSL